MPGPEVILITGTRKGIGRHLAEHFVGKGALVEGCSRQAPDWQLENYTHHLADVTSEKDVRQMMSSIRRRHNRLDVLINNTGIASMNHTVLMPLETASRILNTNILGTFLMCREGAKLMKQRRWGRIVNLGSIAVPMKLAGESVYAASKAAITTFTEILAREVGSWGITCNVVSPAPIATDLIRSVPPEKIQHILDTLPISRMGCYEDVAHVVDFFVHPASDAVTGQVIYLGGA